MDVHWLYYILPSLLVVGAGSAIIVRRKILPPLPPLPPPNIPNPQLANPPTPSEVQHSNAPGHPRL